MLDTIRRLYRDKGLDAVWRWAKDGKNSCARAKRFAVCAVFARKKAQEANEKGKNAEREAWRKRQEVYHHKAVYYSEACAKRRREQSNPKTGCGDAWAAQWNGAASICEREVVPVASRHGVPVTSRKRTVTLSNPSSDHYVGNNAYAVDLATTSGAGLAADIAKELGISGYSTGNYNAYYISRCNRRFRVQILWAVSGHFDHVHTGVRIA